MNKNDCMQCKHTAVCRYREDYLEFVDRIADLSDRLEGDKIAEGIVTVSVKCNYYEQCFKVRDNEDKRRENERS